MPTLNERLVAVLLKSGAATKAEIDTGRWSNGACPYSISTTATGGRQVQIDKGDVLARASGPTLADAITALEAKFPG